MALGGPVGNATATAAHAIPAEAPEARSFARGSVRILAVGNMYPPHHAGGYELMWQAAMQRARELGHKARVLTSDYRRGTAEPETDPDVHRTLRWYWDLNRYEFPELGPLDRLRIERHNARELGRHLDEFQPHVVSWWSMGGMSLSLIERVRRAGLPTVLIVHDDWLIYGRRFDQWIRMWRGKRRLLAPLAELLLRVPTQVDLSSAGALVFNSRYTQAGAGREGVDVGAAKVIYPGIEAALREALPHKSWAWQLLYIGRVDPQKGIDTAVRALAQLPTQATLEVWGSGHERYVAEMQALAGELGLHERVRFRGWAGPADRLTAFRDADVVVFPVRWEEPFGLVPLEAMGLGRPVVSTARGGSTEFLRDGENALVFDVDDPAALAAAVTRLAADEGLRARLLKAGGATAGRFTIERFAEETVAEIVDAAAP